MTELFPTDETLSPRLEWMRRYDVRTYKSPAVDTGDEPWNAWIGPLEKCMGYLDSMGTGETEGEAITALAKLMGWKLWNEEGLT